MALPDVSVVINTCNRARHLADALRALRGLHYPSFELVVVNGPSTDGTAAVLDEWSGRIKRVECPELNLSVSRNAGIAAAAGEIIAFIDDDAVPHPEWLARLVAPYADARVGAVGGYTVDNTGVRWQARKTICDRYGSAHFVSDHFDERPLNRAGTPFYPSLLGTNSSFRAAALRGIGGFHHAFAYLLDETDVCLRLVDAGWRVLYEPEALVWHQFAASHIRNPNRIARTLYPSAVSKAYFVTRHAVPRDAARAAAELERHRLDLLRSNAWFEDHGEIDAVHRTSLDQDLAWGLREGAALARRRGARDGGDLDPAAPPPAAFLPFADGRGLRIALVSRAFPPRVDAGIARWTSMVARGLARRGHQVHVLTGTDGEEFVRYEDGLWLHGMRPEDEAGARAMMVEHGLPPGIAGWNRRVWREVQALKNSGLQALSFPIWDLEGMACLDDPEIGVVLSLHTSYAMARPHKPEWLARPLYDHFHVRRMIAAEARALAAAPVVLANSQAILADLEAAYGFAPEAGRVVLAPHGTEDLLERAPPPARGDGCRVLFVGRFEPRKGFDLAAAAAMRLLAEVPGAEVVFAGGVLDAEAQALMAAVGAAVLATHPRARFAGVLDRPALEDAYLHCDLVLMPSRYESFGLVAIEAMSAGKPVVALAAGGLVEVVSSGVDGVLVPPGPDAASALGAALTRLARAPGERARMGAAARRAFEERFTAERMIDALEPAYRRAASLAATARQAA